MLVAQPPGQLLSCRDCHPSTCCRLLINITVGDYLGVKLFVTALPLQIYSKGGFSLLKIRIGGLVALKQIEEEKKQTTREEKGRIPSPKIHLRRPLTHCCRPWSTPQHHPAESFTGGIRSGRLDVAAKRRRKEEEEAGRKKRMNGRNPLMREPSLAASKPTISDVGVPSKRSS